MNHVDRIDVDVDTMPEPARLRPSIEAAILGRGLADGPEATIARAVGAAVATATRTSPTPPVTPSGSPS